MYAFGITPLIRCVHHLLKELDEGAEPRSPEPSSQPSSQESLSLALSLTAAEGVQSSPTESQEPGARSHPGAKRARSHGANHQETSL